MSQGWPQGEIHPHYVTVPAPPPTGERQGPQLDSQKTLDLHRIRNSQWFE